MSRGPIDLVQSEPSLIGGLVQAVIVMVVAFGVDLTEEQIGAILAVSAIVISLGVRYLVTPTKNLPSTTAPAE